MIDERDTLNWMLSHVQATMEVIKRYIETHQIYLPDPYVQGCMERAEAELVQLRHHESNILILLGSIPVGEVKLYAGEGILPLLQTTSEVYDK